MTNFEDDTYKMAHQILRAYGKTEVFDLVRFGRTYEDKKLSITGLFPLALKDPVEAGESVYVSLIIYVKIRPTVQVVLSEFGLPEKRSDSNYTRVYHWQKVPLFERPGQWEIYLKQLSEEINKKSHEIGALNHQPIDDADFFSDVLSSEES